MTWMRHVGRWYEGSRGNRQEGVYCAAADADTDDLRIWMIIVSHIFRLVTITSKCTSSCMNDTCRWYEGSKGLDLKAAIAAQQRAEQASKLITEQCMSAAQVWYCTVCDEAFCQPQSTTHSSTESITNYCTPLTTEFCTELATDYYTRMIAHYTRKLHSNDCKLLHSTHHRNPKKSKVRKYPPHPRN